LRPACVIECQRIRRYQLEPFRQTARAQGRNEPGVDLQRRQTDPFSEQCAGEDAGARPDFDEARPGRRVCDAEPRNARGCGLVGEKVLPEAFLWTDARGYFSR
jgi:hypothetical protein